MLKVKDLSNGKVHALHHYSMLDGRAVTACGKSINEKDPRLVPEKALSCRDCINREAAWEPKSRRSS